MVFHNISNRYSRGIVAQFGKSKGQLIVTVCIPWCLLHFVFRFDKAHTEVCMYRYYARVYLCMESFC